MTRGPRRGFFDAWSAFYDFPLLQIATYRPLHDAVLDTLAAEQPRAVLDLACGTGQLLARLATRCPAATVVGCDSSRGMLQQAAARAPAGRALVAADAGRPPLATAAFDVVVSVEAFHWFPDQAAALAECRRVLRPGGSLVLAFTSPPLAVVGDAARMLGRLVGTPLRFPTADETLRLLAATGFRVECQRRVLRVPGLLLLPLLTHARRA